MDTAEGKRSLKCKSTIQKEIDDEIVRTDLKQALGKLRRETTAYNINMDEFITLDEPKSSLNIKNVNIEL